MKKLFLTSITAIAISYSAFATTDIAVGTNPASCTEPVLGTTSGESNLQAKWTANTLNLRWTAPDADNWSTQNGICTYDAGITVPSTNPSRTGYTFAGWRVKTANTPAQTTFDLSTLASNINVNGTFLVGMGLGEWCEGWTEGHQFGEEESFYGEEEYAADCSDERFAGLNEGEWKTVFSYGTVNGISRCEEKEPDCEYDEENEEWNCGLEDDVLGICYCKATGFTESNSNAFLPVTSSSWVHCAEFDGEDREGWLTGAEKCDLLCAYRCANVLQYNTRFRSSLYGVTQ